MGTGQISAYRYDIGDMGTGYVWVDAAGLVRKSGDGTVSALIGALTNCGIMWVLSLRGPLDRRRLA